LIYLCVTNPVNPIPKNLNKPKPESDIRNPEKPIESFENPEDPNP